MRCYHGNILTVNANDDVARYLVEDGGKIVYVGNEVPEKYAGVSVMELGEKALVPSFADPHQHFAS
ncbi:MAG: metal-dependent hydrolase with the TIM-barrel fold protein, partial [Clostridia bacterium]|nr:metal-dependent hydrolase with the TIM-barrel fold protein [Clostridia bacterium]